MTIIHSDCLSYLITLPDNHFDCVITSPPYNKLGLRKGVKTCENIWKGANIEYATYDDNMPEEDYQNWQVKIINECIRALKPNGSLFYQHKVRSWERKSYHPMMWIPKSNAIFYQEIIWHRKSTTSMDARYLFNTTERIYWLTKGKPQVFKSQVNEEFRSDVWTINPVRNNPHPAPFPEQLVENCVKLTTQPGMTVFDPFAGSGTTISVANRLGRIGSGTEIDQRYIDLYQSQQLPSELFGEQE